MFESSAVFIRRKGHRLALRVECSAECLEQLRQALGLSWDTGDSRAEAFGDVLNPLVRTWRAVAAVGLVCGTIRATRSVRVLAGAGRQQAGLP